MGGHICKAAVEKGYKVSSLNRCDLSMLYVQCFFYLTGGMLHCSKSAVSVMVTLPCPRCKDDAHSHSECEF